MSDEDLVLESEHTCRILPAWARSELIATEPARDRLRDWVDAGKPEPTTRDIELQLRYCGSGETLTLLRAELTSGRIAPPAVWHLLARTLTIALGRDARGWCVPAPMPAVERLLIIRDDRTLEDGEILSIFKHELAHSWLFPVPLRDLTIEEEALVAGPDVWRAAAACGQFDAWRARGIASEEQACRLAHAWGATGPTADASRCARAIAAIADREAAR